MDCCKGISLGIPPQKKKKKSNFASVSSLMHLHIQLSIISELYAPGQIILENKKICIQHWHPRTETNMNMEKKRIYHLCQLLFDNLSEKVWLRSPWRVRCFVSCYSTLSYDLASSRAEGYWSWASYFTHPFFFFC